MRDDEEEPADPTPQEVNEYVELAKNNPPWSDPS
jgi:hypothetical protein